MIPATSSVSDKRLPPCASGVSWFIVSHKVETRSDGRIGKYVVKPLRSSFPRFADFFHTVKSAAMKICPPLFGRAKIVEHHGDRLCQLTTGLINRLAEGRSLRGRHLDAVLQASRKYRAQTDGADEKSEVTVIAEVFRHQWAENADIASRLTQMHALSRLLSSDRVIQIVSANPDGKSMEFHKLHDLLISLHGQAIEQLKLLQAQAVSMTPAQLARLMECAKLVMEFGTEANEAGKPILDGLVTRQMQKAEYIRILVEKSLKFLDDDELDLSPANVASIERLAYVCGSMDKKEMGKTLQFVKNGVVFTTPARKNKFQTILDSQQIRDNLENLDALLPAAGMKRAEIWNHLRIAFAAECYPQLSADQGL